ncbi:MAG: diadenylate cyclase CdaA [Patescibacteria group bacterium]|nr:diadenylate cyclase CdaA [Patescibacteria group bacterium]
MNTFLNILKSISIREIIDIGILTVITFFIIYSLLESRFLKLFRGIIVICLIFLLANWLNLTLTKTFFQTFFYIIVIVVALIFQPEIRKVLEKFSFSITQAKNLITKKEFFIEAITKSLQFFSQNRIGALLVFENNDNLKPYIQNEVRLNAELSYYLLISIFNKESPLHDGAVIINKNRIKYAGAHLPIGEEYQNFSKRGTRHRAGTVITSETDSFSIIVSEETGQFSLAKEGKLQYNVDLEKIVKNLNQYFTGNKKNLTSILKEELSYRSIFRLIIVFMISLSLTLGFWISYNYNKPKIQKIVEMPIEFKNLKDNLIITSPSTLKIKVTLSALENNFRFFDETKTKLVIDLKEFEEGIYNITPLKEDLLNIPEEIEIINLEPKLIKFKLIQKPTTSDNKENTKKDRSY